MVSAFFTLLTGLFLLLCLYLYLRHNHWKRNGIPTAKGYVPILGHMLPVLMKKIHFGQFIRKVYDEYKDYSMVGIYNGIMPLLILREPNLVKTVLQSNFSSFHENAFKIDPNADPLSAKNPFFCTGDAWLNGRKRLTYAFSNVRLKVLFVAVKGVCKKFENFLNKRLETKNKYEVELKPLFLRFTGEVVANAGLGIEGHCFEDETTASAFNQLTGNALTTSLSILIWQYFPVIGRLLKLKLLPKRLDEFFRKVVAENLEIRRMEPIYRNDFLQLMIDMEKIGEKVDEDVIAAHALSFFLDGTETSSLTLNYIGYDLAVHPDIQEKLRNEVMSKIEKHGDFTYEALKEMTYMNQVISESQRCHTVAGFMHKICTEEFVLQGSDGLTYRAKPGTNIIIPAEGLQCDPKYWTDPEVFDPERFNEERKQTIEKMTFLPFGEGPRICVGMKMAMLQMKACLANLLRNYKLELSPRTQVPLKILPNHFLAEVNGGIWVYITKL
ncbi:cytochrome P450 9e2-like [Bombus vosnesenskii]|uniref:Cytochrome P450 9e2-like n=1 Tax=Bombus vosnesenskii TaxID=207650 RepID=A0A6J3KTC7_9HYME|nr:cytochrome P450 9e2-like [Bombus vosnesenskii]